VTNRQNNSRELWETDIDGSGSRPLLAGWNSPAAECCGNWTGDGRYYVFQSTRQGATNIWARPEKVGLFRGSGQETVQLTFGPLDFSSPVPSLDGRHLFVIGNRLRGELMRYDAQTRQFFPYQTGMSAHRLAFSRDGKWMAFVNYPEGSLWRSRTDGSNRLQLTAPPFEAHLPRWSPDGMWLAFTASSPGQPWKIHLTSVDGGELQQLTPDRREERNPNWSPDGQTIIFDALLDASGNQAIFRCEVGSRQVSLLPDSEGLMSPRWSPDGRYIVALTINSQQLILFDMSTRQWSALAEMQRINYPQWSRNGEHVYFCGISPNGSAVLRVRVPSRQVERVADLNNVRPVQTYWGSWMGLTPDDSPLVLHDTGIQDIYALEWRAR